MLIQDYRKLDLSFKYLEVMQKNHLSCIKFVLDCINDGLEQKIDPM